MAKIIHIDENGNEVPLNGTSNTSENVSYENTTVKTALDTINQNITSKQDKTDNSLATTSKTVVGAINEIASGFKTVSQTSTYIVTRNGNYIHAEFYNATPSQVTTALSSFAPIFSPFLSQNCISGWGMNTINAWALWNGTTWILKEQGSYGGLFTDMDSGHAFCGVIDFIAES